MLRVAIAFVLFTSAGLAHAQVAQCGALLAPAIPVQQTVTAPVTAEFSTPSRQLGAPTGVLSQALNESLSVDQVLFRLQVESCGNVASIVPAPSPASLPATTAGSIVPGAVATPAVPGVAGSESAATPAAVDATDPAAYKPRTEFDNTPWRFDMNQNGQRMTADAFAAWMESKGVRVAKGAPKPAAAEAPVAEGEAVIPAQPATPENDE